MKDQVWVHCSPELLALGVCCATTPRRPCECACEGSHDHLVDLVEIASALKAQIEELNVENEILKDELKVKCDDRNRNDAFEELAAAKAQIEALKTKVSEYSGKGGRAIDRQQEYFLENTALRHKVAELEKDLQQRRDDEPRRFLEWRGISEELGAKVCKACSGSGVRGYANTATWRGGIGGQMITTDICDKCWGSGDLNRPWLDLRHHAEIMKQVHLQHGDLWGAQDAQRADEPCKAHMHSLPCPYCRIAQLKAEIEERKAAWAVCGLAAQGVPYEWDEVQPNASLDDVLELRAAWERLGERHRKLIERFHRVKAENAYLKGTPARFREWLAHFQETEEYKKDSFHWDDMAREAYVAALKRAAEIVKEEEERPLCMCFAGCPECTDRPTALQRIQAEIEEVRG